MPASGSSGTSGSSAIVSVAIGQWAVATAPAKIRTLLGSCVGVVLHDRVARLGGLAHIVLPDSRGATDHPGQVRRHGDPGHDRRDRAAAPGQGRTAGWSPSSWGGPACSRPAAMRIRR